MFSLCIREAVSRWGTSQSSITTRRRTAAVGMLAFSRASSPRSLSITNRCATYHDIAILRTPFNMLLTLAVNKICHKLTIFGIHKRLFFSVDVFPGHIEPGYCWNGWSFSNSIFALSIGKTFHEIAIFEFSLSPNWTILLAVEHFCFVINI